MEKKSKPQRTCVGCRKRQDAADMVRCHRSVAGDVQVASTDHATGDGAASGGRGAWVCADQTCVTTAAQSGAFSRAFRARTTVVDVAQLVDDVGVTYAQKSTRRAPEPK